MQDVISKILRVTILLTTGLYSSFAAIAQQPIKAAYFTFPPYAYLNESGQPSGIFPDAVKAVFKNEGIPFEQQVVPMKRLFALINSKEADFTILVKNQLQLGDDTFFHEDVMFTVYLNMYHLPEVTNLPQKISDFNGRSVVTHLGYSLGGNIKYFLDPQNNIALQRTSTHKAGILFMLEKRAEILLECRYPFLTAIQDIDHPLKNKILSKNLMKLEIQLGHKKDNTKIDYRHISRLIKLETEKIVNDLEKAANMQGAN